MCVCVCATLKRRRFLDCISAWNNSSSTSAPKSEGAAILFRVALISKGSESFMNVCSHFGTKDGNVGFSSVHLCSGKSDFIQLLGGSCNSRRTKQAAVKQAGLTGRTRLLAGLHRVAVVGREEAPGDVPVVQRAPAAPPSLTALLLDQTVGVCVSV